MWKYAPVADIFPEESISAIGCLNLFVDIQELHSGINDVSCVRKKYTDISYQFQRLWDKDVVPGDDDGVESDVRGEMLPQPLVIPQIVRVLEKTCQ